MVLYKGMPNGADPHEYEPAQRVQGAVSYITGLTCRCGAKADEYGAYWEPSDGWCCTSCGSRITSQRY